MAIWKSLEVKGMSIIDIDPGTSNSAASVLRRIAIPTAEVGRLGKAFPSDAAMGYECLMAGSVETCTSPYV